MNGTKLLKSLHPSAYLANEVWRNYIYFLNTGFSEGAAE
jgi:hypothetical protein